MCEPHHLSMEATLALCGFNFFKTKSGSYLGISEAAELFPNLVFILSMVTMKTWQRT